MFSDIEGSTELNERVGDRRWLAIVRRHNSLTLRAAGFAQNQALLGIAKIDDLESRVQVLYQQIVR